jgi:dTDP-glucose 4,6-dehydratase
MMIKILITGAAGNIGSQVVKRFSDLYPDYQMVSVDKLPYETAGEQWVQNSDCVFLQGDLCDAAFVQDLFKNHHFTGVIHLAGEFNQTGTLNLLNAAKNAWGQEYFLHRFYHITSDEHPDFSEELLLEYFEDYGMNVIVSNCAGDAQAEHPSLTIPVYGKGQEEKDWLWVEDEATAIDVLFHQAESGQYYNIAGIKEWYMMELSGL